MSFSLSVQKRLQSLKGAGYCEFVRACNGADSHSGSYRFFWMAAFWNSLKVGWFWIF